MLLYIEEIIKSKLELELAEWPALFTLGTWEIQVSNLSSLTKPINSLNASYAESESKKFFKVEVKICQFSQRWSNLKVKFDSQNWIRRTSQDVLELGILQQQRSRELHNRVLMYSH